MNEKTFIETILKSIPLEQLTKALLYAIEHGIISSDEVRDKNIMKRIDILERHKKFYKIWYVEKDKYWKTKLPDATKPYGKLIKRTTIENLENAIVEYYRQLDADAQKEAEKHAITIRKLFDQWKDYKIAVDNINSRTIRQYDTVWKNYYDKCELVDKPINELTIMELETWCNGLINVYSMNKKKYYNVTVIMRGCFKYAEKSNVITNNVFDKVTVHKKNFAPAPVYKDEERVFLAPEANAVQAEAFKDFQESDSLAPLGINLCFLLGLRVGELAAIKWSDIDKIKKNHIHICRMESKLERTNAKGEYLPAERIVVNHTKTAMGTRDIYLVSQTRRILKMIKEWHTHHHIDSEFIFVNENGDRLHSCSFDKRIVKYCHRLNIPVRRMHSIRRTYISKLYRGDIELSTIQEAGGHADISTTLNNYVYSISTLDEKEKQFENALQY